MYRAEVRWSLALTAILLAGCGPESPPATSVPTVPDSAEPATTAAASDFDALRKAEDLALLGKLVGTTDLGDGTLQSAHDLGTMRLVILERPGVAQTVSVVDLLPTPDLTVSDMEAAFEQRQGEPLKLLGYDTVEVLEASHRKVGDVDAPWAKIRWTRGDEDGSDRGEGSVSWIRCEGSDRWIFVSEELAGSGELDPDALAPLVARFRLCSN